MADAQELVGKTIIKIDMFFNHTMIIHTKEGDIYTINQYNYNREIDLIIYQPNVIELLKRMCREKVIESDNPIFKVLATPSCLINKVIKKAINRNNEIIIFQTQDGDVLNITSDDSEFTPELEFKHSNEMEMPDFKTYYELQHKYGPQFITTYE